MKSVVWYESLDESIPQKVHMMKWREILIALKSAAKKAFAEDDKFDKFWDENWEDLWLQAKSDDITGTKLKSQDIWYAKGDTAEADILGEIDKQASKFVSAWRSEHSTEDPEFYEVTEDDFLK
jgi:hypothetical protein